MGWVEKMWGWERWGKGAKKGKKGGWSSEKRKDFDTKLEIEKSNGECSKNTGCLFVTKFH